MGQEGGWVGAEGADTTRPRLCTKVGGWSKRMGGRGKGADAIRPQGCAPRQVGGAGGAGVYMGEGIGVLIASVTSLDATTPQRCASSWVGGARGLVVEAMGLTPSDLRDLHR